MDEANSVTKVNFYFIVIINNKIHHHFNQLFATTETPTTHMRGSGFFRREAAELTGVLTSTPDEGTPTEGRWCAKACVTFMACIVDATGIGSGGPTGAAATEGPTKALDDE